MMCYQFYKELIGVYVTGLSGREVLFESGPDLKLH